VHPHDAQKYKVLEFIRKIKAEILNAEGSALFFSAVRQRAVFFSAVRRRSV
jgi:hypothetical protein